MRSSFARRRAGAGAFYTLNLETLETRRLLAIVVNTTLDESIVNATTSLREAIAQAATNAGDDEITFDPTVFTSDSLHTITPSPTAFSIADSSGKLTITGPGTNVLAISGSGAGRSFTIASISQVEMTGLQIVDGIGLEQGGGIFNEGELSLDAVSFSGNAVTGADGLGGDPTLPGESGNDSEGGAIWNAGTLTIANATFTNNSATGGAGGSAVSGGGSGGRGAGGAIYSTGDLTITDSDISGNFVAGGTGGSSLGSGANGGDALGGGIYVENGATVNIVNTALSGNSASGGNGADGGLLTADGGAGGTASGGALYSTADVSLIDSSFSSNITLGGNGGAPAGLGIAGDGGHAQGGAIYTDGPFTINTGMINGNTALGGASVNSIAGGGLGGAIFNAGEANVQNMQLLSNTAFGGDSATGDGGDAHGAGIYNRDTLIITQSLLTFGNARGGDGATAGVGAGGAVYVTNSGTVDIDTTTLSSNTVTGGAGASDESGTNGGDGHGGAIRIHSGTVNITTSTLSFNAAVGGAGGEGTLVGGGTGGYAFGGAISNSGTVKLTNTTVYGNEASGGTGGTGASEGGTGGDSFGGGIYSNGEIVTVNVTIASNEADASFGGAAPEEGDAGVGRGGGIYSQVDASLTNTIVADNIAAFGGTDLAGAFTLINSLVTTASDGSWDTTPASEDNIIGEPANLGPLTNNGGPTETALPDDDSPAVDNGDDLAALAEFGPDTSDQRGDGFPRFNGVVDIGAVETGGADITVTGNGNEIDSGDDTPSPTDNTNFGSVLVGASVERTFIVNNPGTSPLTIFDLTLPGGYVIVEDLDATIAAGDNDSFTVALDTASSGMFFGDITILSNAQTNSTFTFAVTGQVNDPTTGGAGIRVNFQAPSSVTPDGYLADAGQVFADRGNGETYGWNLNIQTATRDRNVLSDQARDTLVHMQMYGNRTWEIAVPNGTYRVHLVAGDPSYFDSTYKINVEGVLTVNGKPTSGNRFIEGTQLVKVTDGKLTVSNAAGAINNKLNFIEITPVIAVNFQTPGSPVPTNYLADTGSVFGSRGGGNSYGWNASATSFARDRNSALSPNQAYDTLIHTQLYGNRFWEFGLANGQYEVRVVAGDASYFDSHYAYEVEGILAIDASPTSGNRWIEGIVTVEVTDGRLTISNASGSINNKLAFVEITPVA